VIGGRFVEEDHAQGIAILNMKKAGGSGCGGKRSCGGWMTAGTLS
jgi:hypothetical protein